MSGILTTLFIVTSPLNPNQMIQDLRNWEAEQNRTTAEESINSAIEDLWGEEDGSNGSTESEELLQLPSGQDKPSGGWRHDRRDSGPRVQPDEEGESPNCRCGPPREEDEGQRREDPWDRRNELDEREVDRDYQR